MQKLNRVGYLQNKQQYQKSDIKISFSISPPIFQIYQNNKNATDHLNKNS